MGSDNPTHRSAAVQALGAAARRAGREYRRSLRRDAEAFRNAGVSDERIIAELQIDADRLGRLLAVDGITRCIECVFDLHESCMITMLDDRTDRIVACECTCPPGVSGLTASRWTPLT